MRNYCVYFTVPSVPSVSSIYWRLSLPRNSQHFVLFALTVHYCVMQKLVHSIKCDHFALHFTCKYLSSFKLNSLNTAKSYTRLCILQTIPCCLRPLSLHYSTTYVRLRYGCVLLRMFQCTQLNDTPNPTAPKTQFTQTCLRPNSNCPYSSRTVWDEGLRPIAFFWDRGGSNPAGGIDDSRLWISCIVFETVRFLVQRSPTDCGTSNWI